MSKKTDSLPVRHPAGQVHVNQAVVRTPTTIQVLDGDPKQRSKIKLVTRPMKGRVCYVHSEGRFHVVEFYTPGGPIRESFQGVQV